MASKFLNLSTDTTLGGNAPSDEIVASQKALKTYIDNNSGGGSGLPDQTGQSGKFLTTDGTDASWEDVLFPMPSQYTRSTQDPTLAVGSKIAGFGLVTTSVSGFRGDKGGFKINKSNSNGCGCVINVLDTYGVPSKFSFESKVGFYINSELSTVKNLGTSTYKWTKAYITQLNNGSDITVPTTGGTMVVADLTGATQGQVLTLDRNLNAVWATPSGGATMTYDLTTETLTIA